MTDLFSERDPARVAARLGDIERFADRRERFLEHLDFGALDTQICREIEMADDCLFETIMFGGLYARHLRDMVALGEQLVQPHSLAA